jgi:iron-sulfur cluster assembly protein
MIDGTEVDFASTIQTAGFKFSNPKAKASCGCGTSFTV